MKIRMAAHLVLKAGCYGKENVYHSVLLALTKARKKGSAKLAQKNAKYVYQRRNVQVAIVLITSQETFVLLVKHVLQELTLQIPYKNAIVVQ